jgi:hypothetical protein
MVYFSIIFRESLEFKINEFEDENKNVLKLDNPISLGISKSQVLVQYPLKYRKHFPAQLYEKVMSTVWPFCSEGIMNSEGEVVTDSTCGFRTDLAELYGDVPIVDYSGGFCCSCPAMTVFTGMSDGVYRGDCGLLSSDETAHCLEFSDTLFAGYSIEDYYYDYDITLDLSYKKNLIKTNEQESNEDETTNTTEEANTNEGAPESTPENQPSDATASKMIKSIKKGFFRRMLEGETNVENQDNLEDLLVQNINDDYEVIKEVLSINRRSATNQILSAEIIGDYMPLKPPPDLKDKIFLRPLPKEIPIEADGKVQNDWLIVASNMVSMDGSECDKIGKNRSF